MSPFRRYERGEFDADTCTRCGNCLAECPAMHLPGDRAKTEIASLIRYRQDPGYAHPSTDAVLRTCTSCFACNISCPLDCRPTNLFLSIWRQQYERNGLPERARYFLPHSRPNFRTYVLQRMSAEEKRAVEAWKALDPVDTMFYPGCNLITTPYLTFSKLFDGLPIRGALDYCCGEMYFRMGLEAYVEQTARKCTQYFKTLGAKTVYLQCTAGLNMFTHVLPQFGADFDGIRFLPFLHYLYGQLASGALPIARRFDGKTVTLQDSCHAKIYEPEYAEWPRKILRLLGFEIREAPRNKETALCCGIGSGFSHGAAYGKAAMIRGQRACAHNLRDAHADATAVYCSGCLEMLAVSRYVARGGSPVYHILELIQEAIGEKPLRRHPRAARQFLMGTLLHQRGSRKRFRPAPIE